VVEDLHAAVSKIIHLVTVLQSPSLAAGA
jgi:hypothetical protein